MENPGNQVIELYQQWIENDLKEIRELNKENKLYQEFRERYQNDWETVEMSREILFIHARIVKRLKERIDDTNQAIKEFSRI